MRFQDRSSEQWLDVLCELIGRQQHLALAGAPDETLRDLDTQIDHAQVCADLAASAEAMESAA